MAEPAEDDPEDRPLNERLWDLLVFVPAGVAVSAAEELPRLAAKGREHLGVRVDSARAVGQFAVRAGRRGAAPADRWAARRDAAGGRRGRAGRHRAVPGSAAPPRPAEAATDAAPGVRPGATTGTCPRCRRSPFRASTPCPPPRWSSGSTVSTGPSWCRSGPTRRPPGPADHPQPGRPAARRAVLSPAGRRRARMAEREPMEAVRPATAEDRVRLPELAGEFAGRTPRPAGRRAAVRRRSPGLGRRPGWPSASPPASGTPDWLVLVGTLDDMVTGFACGHLADRG